MQPIYARQSAFRGPKPGGHTSMPMQRSLLLSSAA